MNINYLKNKILNADSTEQSITARQVLIKTAIIAYDRMGDDDLYQQGEDMRTIVEQPSVDHVGDGAQLLQGIG